MLKKIEDEGEIASFVSCLRRIAVECAEEAAVSLQLCPGEKAVHPV